MLKKIVLISKILFLTYLFSPIDTVIYPKFFLVQAQNIPTNDIYYDFFGRKIPLQVREDVIAVSFTENSTRSKINPFRQLKQDLEAGIRGSTIEIKPLGNNYAIVTLPTGERNNVSRRINTISYVEQTLPVLSRSDQKEEIILPNEIIITFDDTLKEQKAQQNILDLYDLEIIRAVRFTENKFVVKSKTLNGTAIVGLANQLKQVKGIESATPNFIQRAKYGVPKPILPNPDGVKKSSNIQETLEASLSQLQPSDTNIQSPTKLFPLQWHLDSSPRQGRFLRTDIRAPEAWQQSNQGEGVVVAVIDSLIQWDHPDLINNLYQPQNVENPLPGEKSGWDFAQNDSDTRISQEELNLVLTDFHNTFLLSNEKILTTYPDWEEGIRWYFPNLSDSEIADFIREIIRSSIMGEFHGTMVTGVIASNSENSQGIMGVAPKAKFLPIRVFGLFGETKIEDLSSAIYYAVERGADVINLSLGGFLFTEEEVKAIFEVLDKNPDLVIIAAAGNENMDGSSFPAAIPEVISVGATTISGERTFYSNYGGQLDLVAPGGDTTVVASHGILTTGGTFIDSFWQGIEKPNYDWGGNVDNVGSYVYVQGTSFSSPIVAGVVALIKDVNPNLSRNQIRDILKTSSSYEFTKITNKEDENYRMNSEIVLALLQ